MAVQAAASVGKSNATKPTVLANCWGFSFLASCCGIGVRWAEVSGLAFDSTVKLGGTCFHPSLLPLPLPGSSLAAGPISATTTPPRPRSHGRGTSAGDPSARSIMKRSSHEIRGYHRLNATSCPVRGPQLQIPISSSLCREPHSKVQSLQEIELLDTPLSFFGNTILEFKFGVKKKCQDEGCPQQTGTEIEAEAQHSQL